MPKVYSRRSINEGREKPISPAYEEQSAGILKKEEEEFNTSSTTGKGSSGYLGCGRVTREKKYWRVGYSLGVQGECQGDAKQRHSENGEIHLFK